MSYANDHVSDKNLTFGMSGEFGFKESLNPCHHCEERHEGCHSSCIKYIAVSMHQLSKYDSRHKWESKKNAAFDNHIHSKEVSRKRSGQTGYAKTKSGKRMVR